MRWLLLLLVALIGCSYVPHKVSVDDPAVQRLLKAAAAFDRTSYGFTAIPQSTIVRLELGHRKNYDAMLHISARTSRTIAFRRSADGYRWTGDQEIFEGPKKYATPDGTFNEHICLTYEVEGISGFPINQLKITYEGEDPRLAFPRKLTLADIKPVLKQWGY
jgi:hypothetical protein